MKMKIYKYADWAKGTRSAFVFTGHEILKKYINIDCFAIFGLFIDRMECEDI